MYGPPGPYIRLVMGLPAHYTYYGMGPPGPIPKRVRSTRGGEQHNYSYVLSPPDLPKGEGGESTSIIGGAQLPQTP